VSSRLVAAKGIDSAPLDDGSVVLFHPTSAKFMLLNQSATIVWNFLEVPRSFDEIAPRLCDAFPGLEPETAGRDVLELVDQLRELLLLQPADAETHVASGTGGGSHG